MKKLFAIISLLIFANPVFCQFKYLQFKLDFGPSVFQQCCRIEIELKYDSLGRHLKVKSTPRNNDLYYDKNKVDTSYIVTDEQINKIGNLLNKLSSEQIFQSMDVDNLHFVNEGYICKLEYGSNFDKIKFSICIPDSETKERNLEVFYNVYKEILKLGKINPKKLF